MFRLNTFNPLFIERRLCRIAHNVKGVYNFQSSFHRDKTVLEIAHMVEENFQSSFHREMDDYYGRYGRMDCCFQSSFHRDFHDYGFSLLGRKLTFNPLFIEFR